VTYARMSAGDGGSVAGVYRYFIIRESMDIDWE